jgi:antitoxin YefM
MLSVNDTIAYTNARNQLASLLDRVTNNKEIVIISRRNKPDVALISKEELSSLLETVYLLRSPANARELFKALEESQQMDELSALEPQTIGDLCEELGIVRE